MTSARAWPLALWAILSLAVFSDRFDWKTRQAGWSFVHAQVERRAQGEPLDSIEHGFRPRVRQAAWNAAAWALPVFLFGTGATLVVARRAAV